MSGKHRTLTTDVLIIGAGPAGCACAIQLLKQGKRVAIFERSRFPRNAPGETLHPGIEPILERLGVMSEVAGAVHCRHNGIRTFFDNQMAFSPYSETEDWQGFQISRQDFDAALAAETQRLGGTIFFNESPSTLQTDKFGNVSSVGNSKRTVQTAFLVDASGRRRWLSKKLGVAFNTYSPRLIAWYGLVESVDALAFKTPQFVWNRRGWTWLAGLGSNRVSWACLDLIDPIERNSDWLPSELRSEQPVSKTKGADVTWGISSCLSRNNWFLAGDAAFTLDPASSHGILKATLSGILLAHIIEAFPHVPSITTHRYYHQWASNLFTDDHHQLRQIYNSRMSELNERW